MNFFESQEQARQKTSLLVFYFIAAVLAIIVAIYLLFDVVFQMTHLEWAADSIGNMRHTRSPALHLRWDWEVFGGVAAGTILLVAFGSLYKVIALASGGEAIAKDLGGRQILPNTDDYHERTVLNVVEEMAIASGVTVPPVFVMDHELGINAFAAGFSPDKAVIGVTRGCIQQLSRDELQGVIAHEFSHILNGDMRLNIRLTGVLHGILIIWMLGYWMLRGTGRVRYSSNRDRGGGHMYLLILGIGLMVVGYIGLFFGRLIKAAVSRQREFLADASAVQFTRNPGGISGALKKLGGLQLGSRIENPNAEEASHFFFANGLAEGFIALLRTHPPLIDRIRRIEPGFDGRFAAVEAGGAKFVSSPSPNYAGLSGFNSAATATESTKVEVSPDELVMSVGTLTPEYLEVAHEILRTLPAEIRDSVHEPYSVRALIFCMLFDRSNEVAQKQVSIVTARAEDHVVRHMLHLLPLVYQLPEMARLPLVDLSLPALMSMSREQYSNFTETAQQLIKADEVITLAEYVIYQVIRRRCDEHYYGSKIVGIKYRKVEQIVSLCSELILALAQRGEISEDRVLAAYQAGMKSLNAGVIPHVSPAQSVELRRVVKVLDELARAAPMLKERIMHACASCVVVDGRVTVSEGELIRAVGDSIGCPVPPGILARSH